MTTLRQVIEGLLFASQKPLQPTEICQILQRAAVAEPENRLAMEFRSADQAEIFAILRSLQSEYAEAEHAFRLVEVAGGWQLVSNQEHALWIRQLYPDAKPARLSAPALETLAIIAYRQPITRADIEAVRGVAVDGVVQTLLERGLVEIVGRAELPGRPQLYGTTEQFLKHFGLRSLADLPNAEELRRIPLPSAPGNETETDPDQTLLPLEAPSQEVPFEPPAGNEEALPTPTIFTSVKDAHSFNQTEPFAETSSLSNPDPGETIEPQQPPTE